MLKKTAMITSFVVAALAMFGGNALAQPNNPPAPSAPSTNPPAPAAPTAPAAPADPNATDAVIGSWGITHASCVSRYGSHRPNYSVSLDLTHTRSEFVLRGKIREESCRIEGSYALENSKISYQAKAQECAVAKLSEQLKPEISDGWMLVTLNSEIADKVCPARNSVLRLYLVRR